MFDFLCRKEQKEGQSTPRRVIVVPPEVMKDLAFKKQILESQYNASRRYLVVAVLCMLGCAVLSFNSPIEWKADIGPVHVENAQPGVLMAILGLALVWWTRFRVNANRPPKDQPNPPTPPTPPTPPAPANEWLICRWLKKIFRRRAQEKASRLAWGHRGIEVPEDCTDDEFWKLAAVYESQYAGAGTIAGCVVMVQGVVVAVVGSFFASEWTATIFWVTITNAPPAIVLMIIGFLIVVLTQFDVKVARNAATGQNGGTKQ